MLADPRSPRPGKLHRNHGGPAPRSPAAGSICRRLRRETRDDDDDDDDDDDSDSDNDNDNDNDSDNDNIIQITIAWALIFAF